MLLWLLVGIPFVAGAGLLVARPVPDRAAPAVGITVAGVAVVFAVIVAVQRPMVSMPLIEGLPIRLAVDGLSAVMVVTVAVVLLAVLVYAAGEFSREEAHSRFYRLMLVFAGAMLVTVTATNLVTVL